MNIVAITVLAVALFTPVHQIDGALPTASATITLNIATVSGSAGSLTGYEF